MALNASTCDITSIPNGINDTYLSQQPTNDALKVDFSWKKFKTLISNARTDEKEYIVYTNWIKSPSLTFKRFDNTNTTAISSDSSSDKSLPASTTIGIGNLHAVKIHADCEVHGQPIKVKARSHFKTQYEHLSYAYNPSSTSGPTTLTWTTSWTLKKWDFICLAPNREPVARFSSNVWAVRKLATLEFMDPEISREFKEELLVTGFTLYVTMVQRANNIFQFFGAFWADVSPSTVEEMEGKKGGKKAVDGSEGEEGVRKI